MKKTIFFITIIFISCISHKDYYNWKGGFINHYGTYHLKNPKYIFSVSDSSHYLKYLLKDDKDSFLIKAGNDIGTFSKWSLYWDSSKSWLWILSSDIGVLVWIPDNQNHNVYKQITVRNSDTALILKIPKEFFFTFPESFKEIYQKIIQNK